MTTKKKSKKKSAKPPIKTTNGATTERARLERRRYNTSLPCAVAPEKVVLYADELAKTVRQIEALDHERRDKNAEFRKRKDHLSEEQSRLAAAVEQHEEKREVEVVEYLVEGTGNIEVVRQDTLEVIETKAASTEDLQESIFGKIDAARAAGAEPEEVPVDQEKPGKRTKSAVDEHFAGATTVEDEDLVDLGSHAGDPL